MTALLGPNGVGKTGVLQAVHSFMAGHDDLPLHYIKHGSPSFLVDLIGQEASANIDARVVHWRRSARGEKEGPGQNFDA